MSKPCVLALSQGGSCAGDCSWCHVTDPEIEYHCKSCNGYFDRLDWDEGKTCAFCGSKNIELVSSIESQQLRNSPDPASAADESARTKSGNTTSLPQVEVEKEKKEK